MTQNIFKINFCIIFLMMIFGNESRAQNSITIQVMNATTTQLLPLATVYIATLQLSTTTDTMGLAILKNVPFGTHTIEVSLVGFIKYKKIVVLDKSKMGININLEPNNTFNEIVITGTMKEVRKSESIVPVELYSPKFFARNPTPSLFEAMTAINGVRPQLQCSVCNTGDIHINGMEGPYTMVLIDGMPIVSGLSTVYGLSGIPNAVIQRIEIVKGPAAALYGSEAMGGIINVITKSPNKTPTFSMDINATSYQEINADAAVKINVSKKIHTLISASHFSFNKRFDINNDNFTDVTLAKRTSVFNKWRIDRPKNRSFDVALRYVNENRFGGEMQWTPEYRGGDSIYGECIDTKRWEILANYQLPVANQRIVYNFSANNHWQDSYYGKVKYAANQTIVFNQITWDKTIHKHSLLLGIAHRYTYYDDNTPVTATANNAQNMPSIKMLLGGFVQDEISISTKNKGVIGLRYDYSNVHKHIVSPRLGIKHKLNATDAVRLNIGNGFRAVNVFSEDHAALTGGRTVVFANALQPERSWNANVNYTKFVGIPDGFLNIDASVFYTYYNNKIVADYLTNQEKIIYDNLQGFATNYGVSVAADVTINQNFKANIGTTYLQSYIVENNTKQEQIQTPNFTANYSLSYTFIKPNICVDFNGHIYSPMLLPVFINDYRPRHSPWFNNSNIQLTKTFMNGMELYGGIKNLFNFYPKEDIIMRAFDPFDRNIGVDNPNNYTFDPSYNYAPVQGIRAFGGLRVRVK